MPSPRLEFAERLDGLCDRAWVNGAFYDDLRGAAELLREAEAALQQAREALKQYGLHEDECEFMQMQDGGCTCGLEAALKGNG